MLFALSIFSLTYLLSLYLPIFMCFLPIIIIFIKTIDITVTVWYNIIKGGGEMGKKKHKKSKGKSNREKELKILL